MTRRASSTARVTSAGQVNYLFIDTHTYGFDA